MTNKTALEVPTENNLVTVSISSSTSSTSTTTTTTTSTSTDISSKKQKEEWKKTFDKGTSFPESVNLVLGTHYTKGGSFFRFFSGNWNKNNISEVDKIIADISNKKLIEVNDILTRLNEIKVSNNSGEFASIRAFLIEKSNDKDAQQSSSVSITPSA